nr:PREDICTED: uncharacterized protein LOC107079401 isoform X2 [Lepisosteus oculatus]
MISRSPEIHQKSSLPSLLNAYLPPECKKQGDGKQQVKEKKRNHGDDSLKNPKEDEDDEVKVMKQVMLDQRHLEAYRNLHRLRDAMYLHYSDLLKQKIQKQRKEMKQHSLAAHKPTEKPRGQLLKDSLLTVSLSPPLSQTVSGQRLAFSTLSHDDQYLQSIPKSSFYLIVDLQNHLTKCGLLKTRQDHEEFWMLAQQYQHRAQKKIKLEDIRKMVAHKSAPNFTLRKTIQDAQGQPKMGHFSQAEKSFKEKNTHSEKAVCEGTTHQHGKHERELDEIEQMFPKLRVPKFFTLQPAFMEQYKAIHAHSNSEALKTSKKRDVNLQKLHHMYSLSFTNMASSQRLLDKNGQFTDFEECGVHNLMRYLFPSEYELRASSDESPVGETFLPRLSHPSASVAASGGPELLANIQKDTIPPNEWPVAERSSVESEVSLSQPTHLVPLTMEELCLSNPVMEAKQPGKIWINYLKDNADELSLRNTVLDTENDTRHWLGAFNKQ